MSTKKKTYQPGERRPRGKQLDGRYRGKIKVGDDAEGNPIYKYASGRTRPELEDNLDELKQKYIYGAVEIDRTVIFSTFVEEWFSTFKQPHIAGSNERTYRTILDAHYLPEFGDRQLRSIRDAELQRFLNDRSHYKESYMKKLIMIGKQIFRRAYSSGVIDRNPAIDLIKPECEEGARRALTIPERKALLGVVPTETNGLWILLLFCCGMRPGEALGLQWGDFDFSGKRVHIQRDIDYSKDSDGLPDTLKNTPSDRWVPIPSVLMAVLKKRAGKKATDKSTEYLLKSPKGEKWLSSKEQGALWDRLMRAAYQLDPSIESRTANNIRPLDEKKSRRTETIKRSIITPYYLRHNYATMLHAKKVDLVTASRWMGHKDPKTMLEFYTHLDEVKEKDDAALFDGSILEGVFDATGV